MASAYMKSKMKNYLQEADIIEALESMFSDESYRTLPGYSIDSEKYPDGSVPFVEDHINYLRKHSQVDPMHYLSNLRLMLKVR